MKIRLISDTHFEFYEDRSLFKNYGEDVLVIAGDLAVGHANVLDALSKFKQYNEHIIYVPGNHEYYGSSIKEFDSNLKSFKGFLNPGTLKIGDVTFIGATLWTNFSNNQFSKMSSAQAISDFGKIKGFHTDVCANLNSVHTKFLKDAYSLPGKKVFVTHFLPDKALIAPVYRGNSAINDYFANDLGNWISDLSCSTWLFGHSHAKTSLEIGGTLVFSNPYGYNYNKDFKNDIFEI